MSRGERFKLARERAELSQGQVAEYAETSQSYLSDIELNKRWPSTWSLLQRLAELCRVPTDYLLGLTDDPSPRRDAPLPEVSQAVLGILDELSDDRRAELLAHAKVLFAAEQQANVREYQRMRALVLRLPDGQRIAEVIDEGLRVGSSGDFAAALALVDAYLAEGSAGDALEEDGEQV